MTNGNNGHNRNGTGNGLVHTNGHKPDAALDATHQELFWDGLSPAVTNALAQPVDPALVSQRRGRAGRTFSYIEGHTVISEANSVFGFGGWGFELVENVSLRQIETVDSQTGEIRTVSAYTAPVRVTVPGALPRTDIGFHAVTDETADGHETAIKGAVTDGMKRALRSFGDRFGNGLYGDSPASGGPNRPERVPARTDSGSSGQSQTNGNPDQTRNGQQESQVEMLRRRLFEIAAEQGFDEDGVRTAVVDRTGKGVDELTADELAPLVKAADNKLREMRQSLPRT